MASATEALVERCKPSSTSLSIESTSATSAATKKHVVGQIGRARGAGTNELRKESHPSACGHRRAARRRRRRGRRSGNDRGSAEQCALQGDGRRRVRHDQVVLRGSHRELHLHQGLLLRPPRAVGGELWLRGRCVLQGATCQELRSPVHHRAAWLHGAHDVDGVPEWPCLRRPPWHHRPEPSRARAEAPLSASSRPRSSLRH